LTGNGNNVRMCLVSLEVVSYTDNPRADSVTLQLALNGTLVHPFTLDKADLMSFPEGQERNDFFERSARTLLDVYGDARDGRQLSDSEVQERTAH
jgi:hypothetical protein